MNNSNGKITSGTEENAKRSIKERIEQTRIEDKRRAQRKLLFVFTPIVVILLICFVFWNSVVYMWISLNIRYGDQETRLGNLRVLIDREDKRGKDFFVAALDGNIFERNLGLRGLRFAGDASLCGKFIEIYKNIGDNYRDVAEDKDGKKDDGSIDTMTNREIAVELLVKYGGADYMEFFISLLSEGNPWWIYGSDYIIRHAGPKHLPRFLEMLGSKEEVERLRASKAVFWLREKKWISENVDVLKAAAANCGDKDWKIRMWSCKIVAALGGEKYITQLLKQLDAEMDNEQIVVAQFIAEALGDLEDKRAIPGLLKLLRSSDMPASSSAQKAVIRISSLEAVPGLIEVARDSSLPKEPRVAALQVFPRLIGEGGTAALELKEVQWALVSIIQAVKPEAVVEDSSDLAVRIEAAKIVNSSLNGSSADPLRMTADDRILERVEIAWNDNDILKALFEAFMAEANSSVKGLLGISLAHVKYPGFAKYLLSRLPDARPSERRIIAQSFRVLTADRENPEGLEFGFEDAKTNEDIVDCFDKAKKWLDSHQDGDGEKDGGK